MPNEMRYAGVDWPDGSPIEGESLAVNGEYTGQHKGTAMQDAVSGSDNEPYLTARETVRYGTLTPDAGDDAFPDHLVQVDYTAAGEVTEISLAGVTYNAEADVFDGVPSKTVSFTFKDGTTGKKATNSDGVWSVAAVSGG